MQTQSEELMAEEYILDPSLVLYLPLYMLDGTAIMSRDAYGHSCTVTGAIWTPQGRSLDGDDFIECPTLFNAYTAGSLGIWMRTDQTSKNQQVISKNNGSVDSVQIFLRNVTGNYEARWRTTATYVDVVFDTATNVGNNVWHFLFTTWDGTTVTAYMDGNQKDTDNLSGTMHDNSTKLVIGAIDYPEARTYWTGTAGEAFAFNRALSNAEQLRLYEATKWRYQ